MKSLLFSWIISSVFTNISAATPDWSSSATLPKGETRSDIYGYGENLEKIKKEGYLLALKWPVEVTGLVVPYEPLKYFLEAPKNPLRNLMERVAEAKLGYTDLDGMYEWLGLNIYPKNDAVSAVHRIPYPTDNQSYPDFRMGASLIRTPHAPNSTGDRKSVV